MQQPLEPVLHRTVEILSDPGLWPGCDGDVRQLIMAAAQQAIEEVIEKCAEQAVYLAEQLNQRLPGARFGLDGVMVAFKNSAPRRQEVLAQMTNCLKQLVEELHPKLVTKLHAKLQVSVETASTAR